jgi:hypothetical protein
MTAQLANIDLHVIVAATYACVQDYTYNNATGACESFYTVPAQSCAATGTPMATGAKGSSPQQSHAATSQQQIEWSVNGMNTNAIRS